MTKTGLFTEYASYHSDRRKRFWHAIGIPSIVLGTLIYSAAIDVRGAVISLIVFIVLGAWAGFFNAQHVRQ